MEHKHIFGYGLLIVLLVGVICWNISQQSDIARHETSLQGLNSSAADQIQKIDTQKVEIKKLKALAFISPRDIAGPMANVKDWDTIESHTVQLRPGVTTTVVSLKDVVLLVLSDRQRLEGELTFERDRTTKLNTALKLERNARTAEQKANGRLRAALSSERKSRASLTKANTALFEATTTLRGEVTECRKKFARWEDEHRAYGRTLDGMVGTLDSMSSTVDGMNTQVSMINTNQLALSDKVEGYKGDVDRYRGGVEDIRYNQGAIVEWFDECVPDTDCDHEGMGLGNYVRTRRVLKKEMKVTETQLGGGGS
ncbi:MAG: hypothetical protein HOC34_00945 [Candidatus Magasanikbacteria bacterium]|jgi:hypothetical protein|nr:hypothetical protein [Candidatus Magasanikbacteria bacterium]MBT4220703.1 hypothetical protein [Candidatus Magasanikbacteria bacterium]MBT4350048.1 hypothetical protein [Candidatus Magasanikbacteria bacterium]MBT4541509.1 hypothetical protein [Candidatus Magasanikbacteria bacterium]MBT6253037.1 hypothetical protein [Candidatus Magasanikbacteria bacterium]